MTLFQLWRNLKKRELAYSECLSHAHRTNLVFTTGLRGRHNYPSISRWVHWITDKLESSLSGSKFRALLVVKF